MQKRKNPHFYTYLTRLSRCRWLYRSTDLVCLSHLRWNFVFQRPQHLLTRFAQGQRVFFIEEPIFSLDSPVAPQNSGGIEGVGWLDVTQARERSLGCGASFA
jgi:hypothetical protein